MTMPGRTTASASYRYGFNGKENDNEVKGEGNSYDFGARMYDPRIGRWLSPDEKESKYPMLSTYSAMANNPLNVIDPDGKEIIIVIRNQDGSAKEQLHYREGNFWHADGTRYNPGKERLNPTMFRVLTAYRIIENSKDEVLKGQLHHLKASKMKHYIEDSPYGDNAVMPNKILETKNGKLVSKVISTQLELNLNDKAGKDFEGIGKTDLTTITHEMRHQYDYDIDNMKDNKEENNEKDPAEIRAVYNENRARDIQKLKHRTKYGGTIDPKLLENPPNNKNPAVTQPVGTNKNKKKKE
jgi:RHS repeat-associated protein